MSDEARNFWIFAYLIIKGVSFQTQIKNTVAISDDTNAYFVHRILLATDKYFQNHITYIPKPYISI